MEVSRRSFVRGASVCAASLWSGCSREDRRFKGGIVGASAAIGHRLREPHFPEVTRFEEADVVIAGGGIAGLAAAREFHKQGHDNFLLLELESTVGGNSSSGENEVSGYPWGAHYVPIPNAETVEVVALFEELGLIVGRDAAGAPIYSEEMLCADPTERLFTCGRWQDGLVPQLGINPEEQDHITAFFAEMDRLRVKVGPDGRRWFAIPVDESSHDPESRKSDQISMAAWLDEKGWGSPALRWYVDYCCRDDYGAGIDDVSAWAGLHYFAARNGIAANAPREEVLTWPEGNGWLVNKLAEPIQNRVRSGMIVFKLAPSDDGVTVDAHDIARGDSVRIQARGVVCAIPRFVAQRVVEGHGPAVGLTYSPWMVANITVDQLPDGRGTPLAWDNVFRDSRSLGYVVATHQNLEPTPRESVLTYYRPLDDLPPVEARKKALSQDYDSWCQQILADLTRVHPGLDRHIRQLDVWLWGHGMIRPTPGFIWGKERERMQQHRGRIHFAHSDMSGVSIFEEAFTRGVHAARAVIKDLT